MADIFLRAATVEDQDAIWRIIRGARLNPLAVHWPRFVVAECAGRVVGVGQIKILGDGSPELASLAVLPEFRSAGVGGALVWALIGRTPGPHFLHCASHNESYYHRFGFHTLSPDEMPPSLRRNYGIASAVVQLINRVSGGSERLLIMGRR